MTATDPSRTLAALGFLLPIFAGGNVFVFLDPRPALVAMAAIAAIAALLWISTRPAAGALPGLALAALFALFAAHVLNLWMRATGPRAGITTLAIGIAALQFFVFTRRPLRDRELRFLILGLAAGTALTVAYAQYQYWYAFPRIAPVIRAAGAEPILSVNANFYNANAYAPFLAAVTLLLAALVRAAKHRASRVAGALVLVPFVTTLWLTGSRATIALAVVIAALPRAARFGWKRVPLAAWLLGAATVSAGLAAAWTAELVQVGLLGRVRIWEAALRMIGDHWLAGVGLGRFAEAFPRYQLDDYFTRYPHNLWLETFAEMGILAAVSLAGFVVAAGAAALARARRGTSPVRLATALAALLLVLHAMVDIDWHAPANPILLLLLLAISGAGEPGAPAVGDHG